MTGTSSLSQFSRRFTSRRGAWVTLIAAFAVLAVLFGATSGVEAPQRTGLAPVDSESAQVDRLLEKFPNADRQTVLIVASRVDEAELTDSDMSALHNLVAPLEQHSDAEVSGPMRSEDAEAALLLVPIKVGESGSQTGETIKAIRAEVADHSPAGLQLHVTGGPAFGADIAMSFDGADFTLLLVTILIVAGLLILTYRSPVLWLIPLAVVGIADGLARNLTAMAANALDLQFDSGIISVLVFGAGTNYALLLISRYREELHHNTDHRAALAAAWRKTIPAILASNVTVVVALLSLVLAATPMTRGLGIPAAIGLLVALVVTLFVLPPALAVFGRKLFWPFIPEPTNQRADGKIWRQIALRVAAKPLISLAAGVAVLFVMAAGLFGTTIGLDQVAKFRVESESASGLEVVSQHFPAGETQPIFVVSKAGAADDVVDAITANEGIVRAQVTATTADGELSKITVTSSHSPSTEASFDQIEELRNSVHAVSRADALVGGATATDLDAEIGNAADLKLVVPLVLAVSFVVLTFLLRSAIAPALLLTVNIASAVAAIGAGSWASRTLFNQSGLDAQVPVLAFLFLVALGIDYTIFLVERAKTEAREHGTRGGMVHAVWHTGSVITSAGIVLTGVFAALGVLPLATLGQLGVIVGLGVIVDTVVVRTVIVPAIFTLIGDRIWWPSRTQTPVSSAISSPVREQLSASVRIDA